MKKMRKIITIIFIIFLYFFFNTMIINAEDTNNVLYITKETNTYGEEIAVCQYSNKSNLEIVILEEGITKIHDEAFANCVNLTDITIPRSVTYISKWAFWNCPNSITVHGYVGSEAETYANNYGYNFEDIEIKEELLPTYIEKENSLAEEKINNLNNSNMISFGYITDIHGDRGTYSSIANIKSFTRIGNSGLLKFAVCAGDITTGAYEDFKSGKALYNLEYYSNMLKKTNIPMLFSRGNHDCNTRADSNVAISGKQYYESVLQHLDGKVTFDSNNLAGNYYYKDLEEEKIRVCVLNAFNGDNYEFVFGNEQLEFVANQVLNLSNKENPQEWQVLFITHTADKTPAHDEVPSDNEKLYSIINAFQNGEKNTIGDINADYTSQGIGTVIAIITGHHHLDTTTVKNNILIVTVRSASVIYDREISSSENYDENDISFDIFSIDKENKILYATKVGRGNDRKWSYDINNLEQISIDENDTESSTNNNMNYININTVTTCNNEVIATVTSNVDFKEKTNQTWKLSQDKKTYIKVLNDVDSEYTTTFTNINGYSKTYTFKINDLMDNKPPTLNLTYINNDDGTITALVQSDEILQIKNNAEWKIAESRREYTYNFTKNTANYTTLFKDIFGNETSLTLNASVFEPQISYIENVNEKTVTVIATSKTKFADTKPTWILSSDGYEYKKTYTINQTYNTTFSDVYGNVENKLITIDFFDENIKVNITYNNNDDATITAIATSNSPFADTKPTWKLSNDGYTYTKIYRINQEYETTFTNIYGNSINKSIKIDSFDESIHVSITYKYNDEGTITAIATSNTPFADTKPTWKLSNDGYTYTKTYITNQNYNTIFVNVYGNSVSESVYIDLFGKAAQVNITYNNNDDGTITAMATSNIPFANTKPTWTLSNDGHTYTKTYTIDQNYDTIFTNIYGGSIVKNIKINFENNNV